jgi:hypothetical protein
LNLGETDDDASVMSDKFVSGPDDVVFSQCVYCARRTGATPDGCDAFPAGIPEAILSNEADHRRPIVGDHGIRFEPRPEVPPEVLAQLGARLDAAG